MPRVKRGTKRKDRRSKILKLAKGYWGMKSRGHRIAKQQVEKALNSAFAGRKDRKGDFRKLWIARINAAARLNGISYSKLMAGLKAAGSLVDRKILADIAIRDAAAFTAIVESAKGALNKQQLRTALDKETAAKRPSAKQASA
jgi:large subunit ribosomal protein L20